jgi:hypothetical protein
MTKEEKLYNKIDTLNSILWDNRALRPLIEDWLKNFKAEERDSALYLLSRCMFFGNSCIRQILRSLYRDKYRAPLIHEIRKAHDNTLDEKVIEPEFRTKLMNTRFLGVGNPSESGVHLLYYFRQENKISKKLFINTDDLVEVKNGKVNLRKKCIEVEHVVFIDDLCGSGSQVSSDNNVRRCVEQLRQLEKCPKISYLMMFGTHSGIQVVKEAKINDTEVRLFDEVEAVMELNDSYKCFGENSRYYKADERDLKEKTKAIAYEYGKKLMEKVVDLDYPKSISEEKRQETIEKGALGFGNCQLLLSLYHNTPNNTLPIIWFDEDNQLWSPIFKRYNKVY